jgi:hypothetical protein
MNFHDMLYADEPKFQAKTEPKAAPKPKPKVDHTEAKAIYAKYLEKKAILTVHQEYAKRVAKATDDKRGKTPVRPLATMGCNGGVLLCDHCLKPIILESTPCYNVPVDEAWARHPELHDKDWISYIKGGLIVYIAENGTLRIYHGYSRPTDCDKLAIDAINAASDAFTRDTSKCNIIWKYIDEELLKDKTHDEKNVLFADIMSVMYSYDPGIGVNHP